MLKEILILLMLICGFALLPGESIKPSGLKSSYMKCVEQFRKSGEDLAMSIINCREKKV